MAIVIIVGTVFVLMLGGVQGTEVDPVRFASRTFYYYRLPFTQIQISPTWYSATSTDFETDVAPYLPANHSRTRQWGIATIQYGAFSDYGDAKIMDDIFWLVDEHLRGDSTFWKDWSSEHKDVAKLFWPIVSEIGVNDAYLILPDFVKVARAVETKEEFQSDAIPKLVSLYNGLAADYAEAELYNRTVTLTGLAIARDSNNTESLKLRSDAYRQLGKTKLADQDDAASRELE